MLPKVAKSRRMVRENSELKPSKSQTETPQAMISAGGQQDERGEELRADLAEPANFHPLRGGRLRGGWACHVVDGPPRA